jgi:2-polyprenyl-3-methyl-5-hydroxy-6-metoxy-1,4-benzoquinol methylase
VAEGNTEPASTGGAQYAAYLARLDGARWKRILGVQRPYRANLRRLGPGFTLDIGCGLGRNLAHLDGHGVGIDHNPELVAAACTRGLQAYTPVEFSQSEFARPDTFDSLLCAHVVEHMAIDAGVELIGRYLRYIRPRGQVIFITPQERGFRSDPTHVEFYDFDALDGLLDRLGLTRERAYSFPLPRRTGRLFTYNEFVVVGRRS